jgi:hypothetical protein
LGSLEFARQSTEPHPPFQTTFIGDIVAALLGHQQDVHGGQPTSIRRR